MAAKFKISAEEFKLTTHSGPQASVFLRIFVPKLTQRSLASRVWHTNTWLTIANRIRYKEPMASSAHYSNRSKLDRSKLQPSTAHWIIQANQEFIVNTQVYDTVHAIRRLLWSTGKPPHRSVAKIRSFFHDHKPTNSMITLRWVAIDSSGPQPSQSTAAPELDKWIHSLFVKTFH